MDEASTAAPDQMMLAQPTLQVVQVVNPKTAEVTTAVPVQMMLVQQDQVVDSSNEL